jgi:hypothetical protein
MIRIDDYILDVLIVSVHRESATATPEYQVLRPWVTAP